MKLACYEMTDDSVFKQANDAYKYGNLNRAKLLYGKVVSSEADYPDAQHKLGGIEFKLGRFGNAFKFFKLAY